MKDRTKRQTEDSSVSEGLLSTINNGLFNVEATLIQMQMAIEKLTATVQQAQGVPEILPKGTYKGKIVDVTRKQGRRVPYWTIEIDVVDYPNKKVWSSFGEKFVWPMVKLC